MKEKKCTYYFYSLVNPVTKKHFYAGRTRRPASRLSAHLTQSKARKTDKDILIQTLIESGLRPIMIVHYELDIKTASFSEYAIMEHLEQHLIFSLLRKNQPLLNGDIKHQLLPVDPDVMDKMWNYYVKERIHPRDQVRRQMSKFFHNSK